MKKIIILLLLIGNKCVALECIQTAPQNSEESKQVVTQKSQKIEIDGKSKTLAGHLVDAIASYGKTEFSTAVLARYDRDKGQVTYVGNIMDASRDDKRKIMSGNCAYQSHFAYGITRLSPKHNAIIAALIVGTTDVKRIKDLYKGGYAIVDLEKKTLHFVRDGRRH